MNQKYDILSDQDIDALPHRDWDLLLTYQTLSQNTLSKYADEINASSWFPILAARNQNIVGTGILVDAEEFFKTQQVPESMITGRDIPWDVVVQNQWNLSREFLLSNWNKFSLEQIVRFQTWPEGVEIPPGLAVYPYQAVEGGDPEAEHPYAVWTRVPMLRTAKFFERTAVDNLEKFVVNLRDPRAWQAICRHHRLDTSFVVRWRNFGTLSFGLPYQQYDLAVLAKYARHINWNKYFATNPYVTREIFETFYHMRFRRAALSNQACKHWVEPHVVEYNRAHQNGVVASTSASLFGASLLALPQLQDMYNFTIDSQRVHEMLRNDKVVFDVVMQKKSPTIYKGVWRFIWKWCTLSEEFIEKCPIRNWQFISKYQALSPQFIDRHWDNLNVKLLVRNQRLTPAQVERCLAYEDSRMDRLLCKYQTSTLLQLDPANPFVVFLLDQYERASKPPPCFEALLRHFRPQKVRVDPRIDFLTRDEMVQYGDVICVGLWPLPFEWLAKYMYRVKLHNVFWIIKNVQIPEWFLEQHNRLFFEYNIVKFQTLSPAFVKKWNKRLDMDDAWEFQLLDRECVERFFDPRRGDYFRALKNRHRDALLPLIESVYPNVRRPRMASEDD